MTLENKDDVVVLGRNPVVMAPEFDNKGEVKLREVPYR